MMNPEKFLRYRETKNISLRNEIVEENLYLVDILIRKYLNKGVDYEDLYQVGAMALVNAVERFDVDKGFEFSSFATPTILGEIRKYFRDKEWLMKVPRRHKEIASMIPEAREKLIEKLGRTPTPTEIAVHLSIPLDEIVSSMESSKAYSAQSLNATFSEGGEEGENAVFEKYTAVQEKGYERFELSELIGRALGTLKEKEKEIFQLRFIENKTQTEIAEILGVSQMTVSRAEKEIRKKFEKEIRG